MKYRDIIGYSNKQSKKKVVKEQSKPTVADVLKEEFGDTINEGPAGDYEPYIHAIDQNYKRYWDSIKDFQKALDKKGLKGASKGLGNAYKNLVLKFHKTFAKMIRKLM